ncbi:MAG: hypothetical protein Rsou_0706 [Candidatus Ruthia sp. Asou_11_S2]|nr:hypothetical protein [Candidatus Ruthia sp. Asou_11_S2]
MLKQGPSINLVGLFTTVNKQFGRVAMHGTRIELLKQQSSQIGLPLDLIEIPFPCSNEDYEKIMGKFIDNIKKDKIESVAFGDLYLEDIRNYRIKQMQGTGIDMLFPCWGIKTKKLSNILIDIGIKAKITCIDPKQLSSDFTGHDFNKILLSTLPAKVDSCGENGEFHTFVYDSPDFTKPISLKQGETVERDGFVFTDWL